MLDGKARVINELNEDVTEQLLIGAKKFLDLLTSQNVNYALLMDGSPSCGSNVLLKEEAWPRGGFKMGLVLTTALLRRNGIQVFGSFDERTICEFLESTSSNFKTEGSKMNLKDIPKFKSLFES